MSEYVFGICLAWLIVFSLMLIWEYRHTKRQLDTYIELTACWKSAYYEQKERLQGRSCAVCDGVVFVSIDDAWLCKTCHAPAPDDFVSEIYRREVGRSVH